ncbi:hypothetical protein TNCV_3722041 [Trichonephila clavipes]|nr:hypothetical protein TNCV_3722041 [Trichonephila clavipes]
MAVNVYQRRPMTDIILPKNPDNRCKIGLTLHEMGGFMKFSETPTYPSVAVILPKTETRFREQGMVTFEREREMVQSWFEIYANLQSPKTPKSSSSKVPYRFVRMCRLLNELDY